MKERFWLIRRREIFYLLDSATGKKESLQTRKRKDAEQILVARNQAARDPALGIALGKALLSARDPQLVNRTWGDVMKVFCAKGKDSTRIRNERAMAAGSFKILKGKKIIETTSQDFLAVLNEGTVSTNHFLRRLHNLALGLGWIPWPVLPPKLWPKIKFGEKRAISRTEHKRIVAAENNIERRLYYEVLWEIGASQSDAANLMAENIDWENRTLVYFRKKTESQSCVTIGANLEGLFRQLPEQGPLFPHIAAIGDNDRSAEFYRRCKLLGLEGISLHSYRYAWAERAKQAGMPERFAMQALGHNSKAVHRAYAKKAVMKIPALEEYEKKIVPMPSSAAVLDVKGAK